MIEIIGWIALIFCGLAALFYGIVWVIGLIIVAQAAKEFKARNKED